ncbi:MAG: long-chain fatty acid--CoA ligase [Hyphomicrobiales bacterium]|nr:long-chain fatty acid--CoA ligase [Hyphomicrobiales bacterium]MDE2115499.1 long-chain fatty acid--CoA ligase [Hyphomicrobiales bacterium]
MTPGRLNLSDLHFAFWPKGLPRELTIPATNLFYNVEVSAARFPDKPFIVFYDSVVTFAAFKRQAEHVAGFLASQCGVKPGDRVLIDMQNSPQFVLAYYGILRAGGVVVPVNPMNLTAELRHYVDDSGAKVAFAAQELFTQLRPLLGAGLEHIIVAAYSDYLKVETDLKVPDFVRAPRLALGEPGVTLWRDMLLAKHAPPQVNAGPDDLCVMPYTSGTTGMPKGCAHTHRNVMSTAVGGLQWHGTPQDSVFLAVLPYFHVTGMQSAMNSPMFGGSTIVIQPRWDRDVAAQNIERYKVTAFTAIPTMVIDFLMNPRLSEYDISSINRLSGGGAAMPEAIAQKLFDLCGIHYMEGYGMSETIAPTHLNPPDRPKKQCLGIPMFGVEARVIDPLTLETLPQGEVGEIIVSGPQIMQGYWQKPKANEEAFLFLDGKRFLRTGDLGRIDEDGYYFMVDRLKRMINAAGFKVWPSEVENMMYANPEIAEVCIVASPDPRRGETVKAFIVRKPGSTASVEDIIGWCQQQMATYKTPRLVEFVTTLPKSGTGKVQWRALQEQEAARVATKP